MPVLGEPLISIGLPVYNGEQYLREAVDSVLAQDLGDFELILCDNASTDATADICSDYVSRDPRVRYVGSEVNRGAAWNYNRAVELARGRYFRWMTHDDRLLPTCLRRCYEAFRSGGYEGLVLVYPRTKLIDANGRAVGEYADRSECLDERPHQRIRGLLRHLSLCNAVLGLTPVEVIRDTRLIGSWPASDKTLLLEFALRGKIREVPEPLFERRRDPELPSPSNMSPAERAAWFDTHSRSTSYQRGALIRESFRAVRLAPLGGRDRARCYWTVSRDALRYSRVVLGEFRADLRRRRQSARARPPQLGPGGVVPEPSSNTERDRARLVAGGAVYSGVKWLGLSTGANQLVRLLTTAVLARILLQEHFGLVTLATTAIYALSTFREIGFDQALIQRQDEGSEDRRLAANTGFWILQAANSLIFTAGWLLAPQAGAFFEQIEGVVPVLRALLLLFLVEGLSAVSATLIQKEFRFQALAMNEMRATFWYASVALAGAFLGLEVWSLVAGQLVSRSLQIAGLVRLSRWRPAFEFSPRIALDLFRFGRWLWLNALLQVVYRSADKIVIAKFAGGATLGAYGIASNLCTAPAKPGSTVIVRAVFPTLARVQNDLAFFSSTYASGLGLVVLLTLPAAVGMIVVAPDFVATVYGPRWDNLAPLIRVLSIYGASLMIGALTRPVLLALGRTRLVMVIGTCRQVLMLACLLVLGGFGAIGVAWAVVLPTLVSLVFAHIASVRAFRGSQVEILGPLLRVVAATGIMAAVLTILRVNIEELPWSPVRLGLQVVVGIVVYLVATRLIYPQGLSQAIARVQQVLRAGGDED